MKKLVLFFAVATAVAFTSCGKKEAKNAEATEEAPAVEAVMETVEEVVTDSVVVDSTTVAVDTTAVVAAE